MTPPSPPASARTATWFCWNKEEELLIPWMYEVDEGFKYNERKSEPSSNSCLYKILNPFVNFPSCGLCSIKTVNYLSQRCDRRCRSGVRVGVLVEPLSITMTSNHDDSKYFVARHSVNFPLPYLGLNVARKKVIEGVRVKVNL